jgi:hypothetical protein
MDKKKKNTEGNDQLPPYGEEEASAYTMKLSWKPFKHQVSQSHHCLLYEISTLKPLFPLKLKI